MMPVQQQAEPADFAKKVRVPGRAYLRSISDKSNIEWTGKDYWRRAIKDLYHAYGGICAYSAHWIQFDHGAATVDHFVPKTRRPTLAYEWDNYRLASLTMNGRKGNYSDVVDPFTLQPDRFILHFPSLLITPNPSLTRSEKARISATLSRLKLNEEPSIKSRQDWIMPYCRSECTFEFLKRNAPFIGYELQRQGLASQIASIMKF